MVELSEIKSGNILLWSTRRITGLGDIFGFLVRLFCMSEYSHIGIAIVKDGIPYVVDAYTPTIKLTPLSDCREFYVINLDVDWNDDIEKKALSYVGCRYSILDAILGKLAEPIKDSGWQCAEMVIDFLNYCGFTLICKATPSKVAYEIMSFNIKDLEIKFCSNKK